MNNIQNIIYVILGCIIVGLVTTIVLLNNSIDLCQANNERLQVTIKAQNEKIKENSIKIPDTTDTEIKEVIQYKYEQVEIPVKDATCEAKLKAINEVTNLYFYNAK